jgi:hypothetical protein
MFASLPFPFTDGSPLLTGTHWFIISPGHDQWVVTFEWNPYRLDGSIANHLDPPVMCALEPWTQISFDHGCRCHESMGKGFCMLTKLIMYQRISKPKIDVTTSTRLWFCTFLEPSTQFSLDRESVAKGFCFVVTKCSKGKQAEFLCS